MNKQILCCVMLCLEGVQAYWYTRVLRADGLLTDLCCAVGWIGGYLRQTIMLVFIL
mgnify:CR=1 FL=1